MGTPWDFVEDRRVTLLNLAGVPLQALPNLVAADTPAVKLITADEIFTAPAEGVPNPSQVPQDHFGPADLPAPTTPNLPPLQAHWKKAAPTAAASATLNLPAGFSEFATSSTSDVIMYQQAAPVNMNVDAAGAPDSSSTKRSRISALVAKVKAKIDGKEETLLMPCESEVYAPFSPILDHVKVAIARIEELAKLKEFQVYEPVRISKLTAEQRRKIIGSRFVDVEKADGRYKSRLVGQQFKWMVNDPTSVTSSTPSTQSFRLMLAQHVNRRNLTDVLTVLDITTAFLHAPQGEDVVIVRPPLEWQQQFRLDNPDWADEEEILWLLKRALYGTVKAMRNWEDHLASVLKGLGFTRGRTDGMIYMNFETKVKLVVHVDDMIIGGPKEAVRAFLKQLKEHLLFKEQPVLAAESSPDLSRSANHAGERQSFAGDTESDNHGQVEGDLLLAGNIQPCSDSDHCHMEARRRHPFGFRPSLAVPHSHWHHAVCRRRSARHALRNQVPGSLFVVAHRRRLPGSKESSALLAVHSGPVLDFQPCRRNLP
jgi:hypothetical protein